MDGSLEIARISPAVTFLRPKRIFLFHGRFLTNAAIRMNGPGEPLRLLFSGLNNPGLSLSGPQCAKQKISNWRSKKENPDEKTLIRGTIYL